MGAYLDSERSSGVPIEIINWIESKARPSSAIDSGLDESEIGRDDAGYNDLLI